MLTMTDTSRLIDLANKFSAHNYHPLPVVISRAEGVWVWDTDGKKYLDMLSSYSALNQGHRHPRIVGALVDQAGKLTLTSRAFHNDLFGLFCELVCRISGQEKVLLMNTGAEAVETAIKAARKWGYKVKRVPEEKAEIVVCENNFHGRTTTVIGFSSEAQYRDGFGPFTPGFKLIPYDDPEALEKAITPNTVGFLVEPIQGEAGIIVPREGYLARMREICRKHNVLLMLDEIQTGLGRTGRLFCHEYENVKPDILIVGKALGGGCYPVSAILASDRIMGVFTPGDHGSTFGGNPLACAVGVASINVILNERLSENAAELGAYFKDRLAAMKSRHVKEIRGRGLLIGVYVQESSGSARRFCEALMQEGILAKETHGQVIRFAPPLVITRDELDWALEKIEKILVTSG
ncbi:MAG: ornithine--oxo-acid transaminase [Candidatus Eisenbacteria bacterium]|nr:ornithine--oxo-acid transaminase [Candidatus Eisenbacteria bacterium]